MGLWLVAAAYVLIRVLGATSDAQDTLRSLREELGVESLVDGTAEDRLRDLRADLADIERGARSPVLVPLRVVPGFSRQLDSAKTLSETGVDATGIGLDVLDELTATLEEPLPTGSDRIEFIAEITDLLVEGRRGLEGLDLGPDGPLLPPLADARNTAAEGLGDLDEFLTRAEAITTSLRIMLSGSEQLLLVANNAEMRSGSGMFLQVGRLRTTDGEVMVEDLERASDITLAAGAVAADSPTYSDLWGFLQPTVEWRNLAASPRFDVTAELAARMWESLGNPRPSGVIAVDPFALRALLQGTGPVTIDGETIGPDEVVPFLLHDQYDDISGGSGGDDYFDSQLERRDRLGALADAAIGALGTSSVDPIALVTGLRESVGGRHVLAWSSDPATQAGWDAAGMSGTLDVDSLMVSVLNRGANKLDPFLRIETEVDFAPGSTAESVAVTMSVLLRNEVPPDEVPYVAGPNPEVPLVDRYGQYSGVLSLSLPGVASEARIEGIEALEVARADGPVLALATKFVLDQGVERVFRVTFEVPAALESVVVTPSARPEPVNWRFGDLYLSDGLGHRVPVEVGDD